MYNLANTNFVKRFPDDFFHGTDHMITLKHSSSWWAVFERPCEKSVLPWMTHIANLFLTF